MAAALDEPAPLIERIGNVLLNGLFGLGLIARDQKGKSSGLRQGASSFGAASFVIASVIEAGQMLAFPFSATQRIWDNTVVGSIVAPMLTVVMPASADVWFGPMAYQVRLPCSPGNAPRPASRSQVVAIARPRETPARGRACRFRARQQAETASCRSTFPAFDMPCQRTFCTGCCAETGGFAAYA